jgi:hypothetical protein
MREHVRYKQAVHDLCLEDERHTATGGYFGVGVVARPRSMNLHGVDESSHGDYLGTDWMAIHSVNIHASSSTATSTLAHKFSRAFR